MSKPTQRQLDAFLDIQNQMVALRQSNDIHSPSHATELEETGIGLIEFNGITEAQADEINKHLVALWDCIARLDPCTFRK